ncbi:hypothetical protein PCL_11342 [Purpureocillium lilacinum]|uniref:Uncharacterized protein n=1 Tax=Purpureocillium lilacinum TaxID=33203 RepID=A0A2U3DPS1_PURLI|nr:hypothetical protein PCL_11342 [Purpureocillium lilacinum]
MAPLRNSGQKETAVKNKGAGRQTRSSTKATAPGSKAMAEKWQKQLKVVQEKLKNANEQEKAALEGQINVLQKQIENSETEEIEVDGPEFASEVAQAAGIHSDVGNNNTNGDNANGSNANGSNANNSNANGSNTNGSNANGSNTNGSNANGSNTNGSNANGSNTNGSNANGSNTNGSNANGSNTNGSNANGSNTNGSNANGSNTNGSNANGSNTNGSNANGSNTNGSNANGSNANGSNAESGRPDIKQEHEALFVNQNPDDPAVVVSRPMQNLSINSPYLGVEGKIRYGRDYTIWHDGPNNSQKFWASKSSGETDDRVTDNRCSKVRDVKMEGILGVALLPHQDVMDLVPSTWALKKNDATGEAKLQVPICPIRVRWELPRGGGLSVSWENRSTVRKMFWTEGYMTVEEDMMFKGRLILGKGTRILRADEAIIRSYLCNQVSYEAWANNERQPSSRSPSAMPRSSIEEEEQL